RVALEAPERVEDGEEDLLGHVLGLGGVAQPLQRGAVDARGVGLVEELEMSRASLEGLLDEFPAVRPGLLTMGHVALLRSPRRSRSEGGFRGGGAKLRRHSPRPGVARHTRWPALPGLPSLGCGSSSRTVLFKSGD